MSNRIKITREELQTLVWSMTKVKVGEQLGISDVAVRKICLKFKVPMPPQVYWLKTQRNMPPSLRPTKGPSVYYISPPPKPPEVVPDEIDPGVTKLLAREKKASFNIWVKKSLSSPHKIVSVIKEELLARDPDDYGRLKLAHREPSCVCAEII